MATLQQQYNLIKEGKGDKNFFLKQAMNQFPEYITVHNTFEQTVSILKGKSIIAENTVETQEKKDWFKIFEAVVKNMAKDVNYYAKNGMFGVKGIGLETSAEPKAPKGKHKASGYGDLDKK